MNSKSLRRLAADHASLHKSGLPPNYLFPPDVDSSLDNLTSLDVILAGPDGTPYSAGAFRLHLEIPPTYPTAPPTACFKTRLWHPNVDESTGAVCVETLKRDWKSSLTLRDVLVTISCLLIQPNPASALNAEAGRLLQEGDWTAFERRARLMTSVHAGIQPKIKDAVEEARRRGEDDTNGAGSPDKGKSRFKSKQKARTKSEALADEEPENVAQNILSTPIHNVESDPDASWIPQPPAKRSRTLNLAPDNIFGIQTSTMKPGAGEDLAMEVDSAPLIDTQASDVSFWDFAVPSQTSFLATNKGNAPRTPQTFQQPTTPLKHARQSNGQSATPFATSSDDPFGFALCWLAYQRPPITPSGKGKNKAHGRTPSTLARDVDEYKRLKAADFCIKKYNRGDGGPRRGLRRL